MGPLAADDDGELSPADAVLDVEPSKLPRDRRVLLRGMRRAPRIDAHRRRCAMRRGQLDVRGAREDLREPERRHRRRALEREHVRLGIRGDHEIVRAERLHERLLRVRGVVVVVDEEMIEERSIGRRRRLGPADQGREVHAPIGIQDIEIRPVEARELVPAGEPTRSGLRLDLLRRETSLLRAKEELSDLVREPTEREEVTVRRPLRRILSLEEILHESELIGGREDLGRLRVPERGEALAEDQMPEPVEGQHLKAGERGRQPGDQRVARRLPRAARSHDQRHSLRIRSALDDLCEPLAEHRGLAGASGAGDEEWTGSVRQDGVLQSIGGEGGVHEPDATASRRHPRGRAGAAPAPLRPPPSRPRSVGDTTGRRRPS